MNTFARRAKRAIVAAIAAFSFATAAGVAADEVNAPVEVDPFVVVAIDGASEDVDGNVDVTSTITVDAGEDETVALTPAPVEVDPTLTIEEDTTTPVVEVPTTHAVVEVTPTIDIEVPVVDPAEDPITEVPNEAPTADKPALELPVEPKAEEPVQDVPAPKNDKPVIELPVEPKNETPAPVAEVPAAPVAEQPVARIRVPFTGTLPNTGEESSALALVGGIMALIAIVTLARRREEA